MSLSTRISPIVLAEFRQRAEAVAELGVAAPPAELGMDERVVGSDLRGRSESVRHSEAYTLVRIEIHEGRNVD